MTRRKAAIPPWIILLFGLLLVHSCMLDRQGTEPFGGQGLGGQAGQGGQGALAAFGGAPPGGTGGTAGTGGTGGGGTGGTGGGGTGGETGGGGTGGGTVSWIADDPGPTFAYVLPSWLALTSTSANKTTETSPSTLATGFGPNAPRARNVGGGWGLSIESGRYNNVKQSDSWTGASSWAPGNMAVVSGISDPAGGTSATQFDSPAPGALFSNWQGVVGPVVASTWAKGIAGTPPFGRFRAIDAQADIAATSWTRYVVVTASTASDALALETRGLYSLPPITASTSTAVFGAQVEPAALYASSYIPTTNAAGYRAAEKLRIVSPATLFASGYFDVELVIAPRYASNQLLAAAVHDLLYFDADHRLYVERAVGPLTHVCLVVAGIPTCTIGLTWPAEAPLTVRASHQPTGVTLAVSGADEGQQDLNAAPQAAINPLPSAVELLGNGKPGAQECADLRALWIYPP